MNSCINISTFCDSVKVTSPPVCPAPAAGFTVTTISLTANFTNTSVTTGATSWSWDFGEGGTSSLQNPSYTYSTSGTYTVALTAANSYGSYIKTKIDYITVTTWSQKADFGGVGRYTAVGFSIGSKGYIGTGYTYNPTSIYFKDFWEYDPGTNLWTQKADFGGTGTYAAVGFSIGSKGYIGTGIEAIFDFVYTQSLWEYDPGTNLWTRKADFAGTARSYAVGFSIGSKGYIGTGNDDSSNKKDFWEYTP